MKIIEQHQDHIEHRVECHTCKSVLLINESDLIPRVDILCGEVNLGAPDLCVRWECPVCRNTNGGWLYEFPWSWHKTVEARIEDGEEKAKYHIWKDRDPTREHCPRYWSIWGDIEDRVKQFQKNEAEPETPRKSFWSRMLRPEGFLK